MDSYELNVIIYQANTFLGIEDIVR